MGQSISRMALSTASGHYIDATEKAVSAGGDVDGDCIDVDASPSALCARRHSSVASMPQPKAIATPPRCATPIDQGAASTPKYGTGAEAFLPPMQRQSSHARDLEAHLQQTRRCLEDKISRLTPEEWQALERCSEAYTHQSLMFSVDGAGQQRRRRQRQTWWQALTGR